MPKTKISNPTFAEAWKFFKLIAKTKGYTKKVPKEYIFQNGNMYIALTSVKGSILTVSEFSVQKIFKVKYGVIRK